MVLDRDKFFEMIKSKVGEDTGKEALEFLENVTDTYNDLTKKLEDAGEYTKEKYDALDKEWAEKYKARFFEGTSDKPKETKETKETEEDIPEVEQKDFDSLFEEVK